jgi:hypothetical protein
MGKDLKMEVQRFRGESAYEVAVRNGFEGTEAEWLASLHASSGTVNGIGPDETGAIKLRAGNIPMSAEENADTVDEAINKVKGKANAAVRYNEDQTLTDGQKAQARTNIGATSAADVDEKVSGSVKATTTQTFTNDQKTQARTNISAAATASYTATLTVAGWTGTAAPYTQEATVAGILASDSPFVDVDMTGLASADDMTAAQDAFGLILKATAGAGKITFVASDKPDVALTVKIKVVR